MAPRHILESAAQKARRGKTQTRRRFGGRQPLCGIGVTSRIAVTARPTACSARRADSRPEPGPRTSISRVRMPCSIALRPAFSAAICAAKGVDLREPLKPCAPDDDQAIVLPCASVIVTIVLLKEAFTWATPAMMFLRSLRRGRATEAAPLVAAADLAMMRIPSRYLVTFFLPAIGLAGPLRVRALVWVRWPRTGRPRRCLSPR